MASQMALDVTDVESMTLAARQIPAPTGILRRWLPNEQRRSHRFKFRRSDRSLRSAAPVRAWDTPAVVVDRGSTEEVEGRMLPISIELPLGEEESQLLDDARADDDADAIEALFDEDTLNVTTRILQRVTLFQGEAVSTGKIEIGKAFPENGLQLPAVDFEVPASHIVTAANLYSNPATSILSDFALRQQIFTATNGGQFRLAWAICSTAVAQNMLANEELRELAGTILGVPSAVTLTQMNAVLLDRGLPQVVVDDSAVPDHNGFMTREIPEDRVIFLPNPPDVQGGVAIGKTQWGTTEEAKKLVRAEAIDSANAPGLVVVPMENTNPVTTSTLGTAIVMPVITEPDLIMSVKVR